MRHPGGVKIHEAQAFEALQRQEAVEQCTEILLAVEIPPPFREILRHEIQFLDPLIQQGAGLADDHVLAVGAVPAPDIGDGAERTGMAAAVADLEPCVRRAGAQNTARNRGFGKAELPREHGGPLLQIAVVQPEIHFGQLRGQIFRVVTPHETPGDRQQRTLGQLLDVGDGLRNRPHGFLRGGLDKGTGIDEDKLGLIRRLDGNQRHPKGTEKTLSVHPVLRAAEACGITTQGNGHDAPHSRTTLPHSSGMSYGFKNSKTHSYKRGGSDLNLNKHFSHYRERTPWLFLSFPLSGRQWDVFLSAGRLQRGFASGNDLRAGPDEGIFHGRVPALSRKATPNLLTEHRIGGKLRGARVRRATRWWYAI